MNFEFIETYQLADFLPHFLLVPQLSAMMKEFFIESILIIILLFSLIDSKWKMRICVYLQNHDLENLLQSN